MRLTGIVLALVLATTTAYADKFPFELVRMLPETKQVLVFDRSRNTHVLLQPGSQFDDYVVIEVSGLAMIVQKQQERFTVYPREAQHLALNILPRDQNVPVQPVIYGKAAPLPASTQVADAKSPDAKKAQVARELSLMLADAPPRIAPRSSMPLRMPALTTPPVSSKLKP